MLFLFLLIWLGFIVTAVSGTDTIGYSTTSDFYTRLVYMFAHINLLHIVINTCGAVSMTKMIRLSPLNTWDGRLGGAKLAYISYICAVLATFGSECAAKTIGASGIVFALFGIWVAATANRVALITFLTTLAVNIPFSIFANVNWKCHLLAFIYGLVYGAIVNREKYKTFIKKLWTRRLTYA